MKPATKVIVTTFCSTGTTLGVMAILCRLPGMSVPFGWWVFAAICPTVISAAVAIVLVRQIERVRRLSADLADAHGALRRLAERDHLTGLLNRRSFEELAAQHPAGWLILIDIDHFKGINDACGHAAGDLALVKVAEAIREAVRDEDIVARVGGDEFAVFCRHAPPSVPAAVAERIRVSIGAATIIPDDESVGVVSLAASIGFAQSDGDFERAAREADRAMYRAKQGGRNRVCAPSLADPPLVDVV